MATYDKQKMLTEVTAKASATWKLATQLFGPKVGVMPEIRMNARLTSTGGRAMTRTQKNVAINPMLVEWMDFSCFLLLHNHDEFLGQTVPHECAHFIALRVYGDEGHGKGFKFVMEKLGCRPERCHSMKSKAQMEKEITPRKRITSEV
jgi:predicted SprT family Zn-dependent metalloprotease